MVLCEELKTRELQKILNMLEKSQAADKLRKSSFLLKLWRNAGFDASLNHFVCTSMPQRDTGQRYEAHLSVSCEKGLRVIKVTFVMRIQCRNRRSGESSFGRTTFIEFMNINYLWNAWEGAGPCVHKLIMASSSSTSASLQTSTLAIDKPHQPLSFPYPKRPFRKTTIVHRSFQSAWYSSRSWLHYNETNDTVLCHLCAGAAARSDMVTPRNCDTAFVSLY